MNKGYKVISKPIPKKDAMQLVTGKPVYTDDIVSQDCLILKILRSPYASAIIEEINVDIAKKVPGIEDIYTYKDVPQIRFTNAGQNYVESSPYDRLILDQRLRYIGDAVAIVAGENEKCVNQALKLIKVKYKVLEPVLDFHQAIDNPNIVHPEEDWECKVQTGYDVKRNITCTKTEEFGDVEKAFEECDAIVEGVYHIKSNNQTMMETFRTYCEIDTYGRLHVISSTQIVFHTRRIIAQALGIPKTKVRVTKPRIGGGFGAKQTVVSDVYPAFVTWKTKKPSKLIYSREESMIAGSPRHEMEVSIKMGATKYGIIKAVDIYTLSNTGAYGEHGMATVIASGHKSLPMYTTNMKAYRFGYDVVYTNKQANGAFRGFGAPQGIFAVESSVNLLAKKLGIDPTVFREKNLLIEGIPMPAYYHQMSNACALDRCMAKAKEMMDWDNKFPYVDYPNHKRRSVGVAMGMQGSGVANIDSGSATVRLTEDGQYQLIHGAADMGTGSDTILSQILAETMDCTIEDVEVFSADTEFSPYDSGSYASSTTYVTGKAVEKAGLELRQRICHFAAEVLQEEEENLEFHRNQVVTLDGNKFISLTDIATKAMNGYKDLSLQVTVTHSSPVSPPPYMVGMVEIELDMETGEVKVLDFVGVVDCGTVMNEALARVQTEGGITQGIGMALYEDISYNEKGRIRENSFMTYKVPTRLDNGTIRVAFESSYEPTGPYGAKSIGECVLNTPVPAIADAIFNATGHMLQEVPFTPEKIVMECLSEK